jgi:hypothetical protein
MDKLTVAHHIGMRHAYLGIVQKNAWCSVDNNTHIVVVLLFHLKLEVPGSNHGPPTFFLLQKTHFSKFESTIL